MSCRFNIAEYGYEETHMDYSLIHISGITIINRGTLTSGSSSILTAEIMVTYIFQSNRMCVKVLRTTWVRFSGPCSVLGIILGISINLFTDEYRFICSISKYSTSFLFDSLGMLASLLPSCS